MDLELLDIKLGLELGIDLLDLFQNGIRLLDHFPNYSFSNLTILDSVFGGTLDIANLVVSPIHLFGALCFPAFHVRKLHFGTR